MNENNNTLKRHEFIYKFALLTLYASLKKIKFIITDYIRTAEDQNKRFKEKKSLCDGYENVSMHQKARAIDVVVIDGQGKPLWDDFESYEILGRFWEGLDGSWGYRWYERGITKFKDYYHYEY